MASNRGLAHHSPVVLLTLEIISMKHLGHMLLVEGKKLYRLGEKKNNSIAFDLELRTICYYQNKLQDVAEMKSEKNQGKIEPPTNDSEVRPLYDSQWFVRRSSGPK